MFRGVATQREVLGVVVNARRTRRDAAPRSGWDGVEERLETGAEIHRRPRPSPTSLTQMSTRSQIFIHKF